MKKSFKLALLSLTTIALASCDYRNGKDEYMDPFTAGITKLSDAKAYAMSIYYAPIGSNITTSSTDADATTRMDTLKQYSSLETLTYVKDQGVNRKAEFKKSSASQKETEERGIHKYIDGKYYEYTVSGTTVTKGAECTDYITDGKKYHVDFNSILNAYKGAEDGSGKYIFEQNKEYLCQSEYVEELENILFRHIELDNSMTRLVAKPASSNETIKTPISKAEGDGSSDSGSSDSGSSDSGKDSSTTTTATTSDTAKIILDGRNVDRIEFKVHGYYPDCQAEYTRDVVCSFKKVKDTDSVMKPTYENAYAIDNKGDTIKIDRAWNDSPTPVVENDLKTAFDSLKSATSYTIKHAIESGKENETPVKKEYQLQYNSDKGSVISVIDNGTTTVSGALKDTDGKLYGFTKAGETITKGSEVTEGDLNKYSCNFASLDDTKFTKSDAGYTYSDNTKLGDVFTSIKFDKVEDFTFSSIVIALNADKSIKDITVNGTKTEGADTLNVKDTVTITAIGSTTISETLPQ